jgi:hypothetical protein
MARTNYKRHTDDDDDMRNILKDGERMRVPMYAMDGSMDHLDPLQRTVVRDKLQDARITDGAGNSGLSLHKPGFRISNTVTRDRSIYDAYDAQVASAYRNVGAGESEFRGQREGDSCTAKSDQGRDGSADSKLNDAMRDEREAAHQEYQDRIQNAWREGR